MKGVIIASHGKLAEGMLDTLKIFCGEQNQIKALCLEPGEDLSDFAKRMVDAIQDVDTGDGVVIFCDLLFGTPCNTIAGLLRKQEYLDKLEVITGMNLSMILEYLGCRETMNMEPDELVETGKSGIVNFKKVLKERMEN